MKVPAGSTEFIPWKDAADEIVGMMKKVRQESSEGGNIEITGTITVEQYNLYIWIFLRCAFFCKKFCFHLICKMLNIYKMCYMGINSNITKNKISNNTYSFIMNQNANICNGRKKLHKNRLYCTFWIDFYIHIIVVCYIFIIFCHNNL